MWELTLNSCCQQFVYVDGIQLAVVLIHKFFWVATTVIIIYKPSNSSALHVPSSGPTLVSSNETRKTFSQPPLHPTHYIAFNKKNTYTLKPMVLWVYTNKCFCFQKSCRCYTLWCRVLFARSNNAMVICIPCHLCFRNKKSPNQCFLLCSRWSIDCESMEYTYTIRTP